MKANHDYRDYFEASTQYNDMLGSIAIDGEGMPAHDLAELCGVDVDRFFPLHISLGFGGRGPDGLKFYPTFMCFDKNNEVEGQPTDIEKLARERGGKLPVVCVRGRSVDAEQALELLKRMDVCLSLKGVNKGMFHLDVVDEVEIE